MIEAKKTSKGPTPGPWSVGYIGKQNVDPILGDWYEAPIHVGKEKPGNCLAIVYLGGDGATDFSREAVEANARLISAAPDMLEALEAMVSGKENFWILAKKAISKASGE